MPQVKDDEIIVVIPSHGNCAELHEAKDGIVH
jgi:hypothetical protein